MNNPQYKINGNERRLMKKYFSQLKSQIKNFWYYHNEDKFCYAFYGCEPPKEVLNDEKAKIHYNRLVEEFDRLNKILKEPYDKK